MRRIAALLLPAALMLLLAAPAQALPQAQQHERRVALVIGNGAYKQGPLKNPANDARDMASALKSVGFEVILRENASLRSMNEAIDQFWQSLKKGGVGLFFFAGHGLQVAGENYLVPVDAKIALEKDVQYECVNAGKVLGRMEDAGNGLNLVILDACRNNPFARSFRSADQGLAKMDAPTGSLVAFATAPGDVAADGAGKNGLYTSHLLRHLRTPGLTIEKVLKQTRIGVAQDSAKMGKKQTPWESSSLMGDFYFTPDSGASPASAPAPVQTAFLPTTQPASQAVNQAASQAVSQAASQAVSQAAAQAVQQQLQKPFEAASADPQSAASAVSGRRRPAPAAAQAATPTTLAALPASRFDNRNDARINNLAQAQAIADARNNPPRGWLGVELADVTDDAAKAQGLAKPSGALVRNALPGSPAEAAGLRPGDVILAVNGQDVGKPAAMVALIGNFPPGETVQIDLWRDRQKMRAVAELTTGPQTSPLAGLKVRLIYTDDRLGDAQKAQRALEAQGMTVDMFPFTKNNSYQGHIGKLYAIDGYIPLAQRVAEVLRPIENMSINPSPVKASDGQQFNLWIAR